MKSCRRKRRKRSGAASPEASHELELALEQKLLEFRGDLATEDAAQNTNGQKEARGGYNPSGAVEG